MKPAGTSCLFLQWSVPSTTAAGLYVCRSFALQVGVDRWRSSLHQQRTAACGDGLPQHVAHGDVCDNDYAGPRFHLPTYRSARRSRRFRRPRQPRTGSACGARQPERRSDCGRKSGGWRRGRHARDVPPYAPADLEVHSPGRTRASDEADALVPWRRRAGGERRADHGVADVRERRPRARYDGRHRPRPYRRREDRVRLRRRRDFVARLHARRLYLHPPGEDRPRRGRDHRRDVRGARARVLLARLQRHGCARGHLHGE